LGAGGAQQLRSKLDEVSRFLPAELILLSEVHIEVHTDLPNTLILPDYDHLR
jgi:hypothetical protein